MATTSHRRRADRAHESRIQFPARRYSKSDILAMVSFVAAVAFLVGAGVAAFIAWLIP